jgi:hypothetical protein
MDNRFDIWETLYQERIAQRVDRQTTRTLRFYTVASVGKDKALLTEIARESGGYTVDFGDGGWINDDGHLVEEPSATITVFGLLRSVGNLRTMVDMARVSHRETAIEWSINDVAMPTIRDKESEVKAS